MTLIRSFALAVAACVATTSVVLSETALEGKTLRSKSGVFVLGPGGKLSGVVSGKDLTGTWEVKAEKFCRTIHKPEEFAGSQCQGMVLDGNTLQLTREDGSKVTFSVE